MTHLEQRPAEALAREEAAKAHREEILAREEDGMLEQVETLVGRDEGLQEEVNRRKEETVEVGVARQLLLEQSEEREQERREAEQRITALQAGLLMKSQIWDLVPNGTKVQIWSQKSLNFA